MVVDQVIRGICHDLNGRIHSLTSLSYLLSTGSGEWARVGPAVEDDLENLEELTRLLRILPDDDPGPRALALGELLPRILRLIRLQPGCESVEYELVIPPDFPAVRMDEALLFRSLSLLLTGMAEQVKGHRGGRIKIGGRSDSGTLTIRPGRTGPGAGLSSGDSGEGKRLPEDLQKLLAGVLQEIGGELAPVMASDGDLVFELRLPRLEG